MNKLKFFTGLGMISPIIALPIILIAWKILGKVTLELFVKFLVGICFLLYVLLAIYLIIKGLLEKYKGGTKNEKRNSLEDKC